MNDVAADIPPDPLILDTSRVLGRVSWLSWWAQVILSVVASVTLLLCSQCHHSNQHCQLDRTRLYSSRSRHCVMGVSIFWTWSAARLSRRFRRQSSTSSITARNMLRRAVQVGCTIINLISHLVAVVITAHPREVEEEEEQSPMLVDNLITKVRYSLATGFSGGRCTVAYSLLSFCVTSL